jgi:alpha-tubulin suppressor-like RCC1 family protein
MGGCYRAAPPLEEDEIVIEENTAITDGSAPQITPQPSATNPAGSRSQTPPSVAATPTPTPVPTPQRPNNLPLIMQIADQTANEDSQIEPISFRIFDFDDAVQCQDIVPSSSDLNAVETSVTVTAAAGTRTYADVSITGGQSTECGITIKTKYARVTPATLTLTLKDPSDLNQESKSSFKVTVNSTNTAPFVKEAGNSSGTLDEDSNGTEIQLAKFDDGTKRVGHTLSLVETSSPTLGTLVWPSGFPNNNGSVYYKPLPDKNGIDSFSYKVCDNDPGIAKCTDPQTIVVNVQAKNDPPTMNPIADQTTSEATAKTIEFLVDDKDGPLTCVEGNLNYTVITEAGDTSGLVAATGAVVWGGTWPLCTGTLTPEALKSGTTHIRFSINDGSLLSSASRTFKLTVTGVNHPPEILTSIPSQSVNEDSSVSVNFQVKDINEPAGGHTDYACTSARLSYESGNTSLVAANGRVSWSGTWPNCVGTISPNTNANGTVNITFVVTDPEGGGGAGQAGPHKKTFQLTINAVNDSPTGTVVCDYSEKNNSQILTVVQSTSQSNIVLANRSGTWTVTCSGASDVDNETLSYTLNREAGSPFNNSAGFSCPATLNVANLSQAFSTTSYGTCRYKARACDAAVSCTADTTKFIEITSFQLDLSTMTKPQLDSSCSISSTVNYSISQNIASFVYRAKTGLNTNTFEVNNTTKSVNASTDSITFNGTLQATHLIASPPLRDTAATATTATLEVTSGSFIAGTQGGAGTGNTISNTKSFAYSIERKLEKLALKSAGAFTPEGVGVDGLQVEYVTTPSVCRRCTSQTYGSISAGALHSCLTDNGLSKCWGSNQEKQLGLANSLGSGTFTFPQTSSTQSATTSTSGFTLQQLAAGSNFTCALGVNATNSSEIRCVGNNAQGQLGIAAAQSAFIGKVALPSGHTPVGIAASKTGSHACALVNQDSPALSGKIFCWGNNEFGQLGNGSTTAVSAGTLVSVATGDFETSNQKSFSLAVGKSHTCSAQLLSNGSSQAYCWGKNSNGQLGLGDTLDSPVPQSLSFNDDIIQVAAGENHSCALSETGEVYCWGDNSVGQLGIASTASQTSPVKLTALTDIVQITTGANHTCALNKDYQVYCWGLGTSGQLGVGKVTTSDQSADEDCNSGVGIANITFCKKSPAFIDPAPSTTPVSISAGENHTCMMTVEGNAYCWGANASGQLGTANRSQVSSPSPVCSSTTQCNNSGQLTSPRPRMCSRYAIPP